MRKIIGMHVWNKALTNSNREKIIEYALKIHIEFPNIWGTGWPNFDWALGNAVREIAYPNSTKDVACTWNADDVLTEEELKYVKTKLGFKNDYEKTFK